MSFKTVSIKLEGFMKQTAAREVKENCLFDSRKCLNIGISPHHFVRPIYNWGSKVRSYKYLVRMVLKQCQP